MTPKEKYQPVLDLGADLDVKDGYVEEEGGTQKMGGTTETQYEKDLLWNKIKAIGGDNPSDIEADIKVAQTDHYHKHTVEPGDTLSGIAKTYYGDASKYMRIFKANDDQLDDPNRIDVGQVLTIPFPEQR